MKNAVVNIRDVRKLWMSQKEVMSYLGVSKDWIKKRREEGMLNYSVVGNTAFYIKSQIDKIVSGNAVTGADKFRKEITG